MIKGIFVSLAVAAVCFAAAGISVAILGTKSMGTEEFEDLELFPDDVELTELVAENELASDREWEFDARGTLGIISSGADTRVKRISGDKITLSVKPKADRTVTVTAAESADGEGYLGISVRGNWRVFGFGDDVKVEIGLPDSVYHGVELELNSGSLRAADIKTRKAMLDIGSGELEYAPDPDFEAREFKADLGSGKLNAADIRALDTELNIGSGKIEFTQSAGFKADDLEVSIGSGSVVIKNADTHSYEISMGSGSFDISGLTGTGEINIGSGNGVADFAAIDPDGSRIDLSSGSLNVYIPRGASAEIDADISTGSVSVNCGGVSQKLTKDGRVSLGSGGGELSVDVSSGKVTFRDSDSYANKETAQIAEVTITDKDLI